MRLQLGHPGWIRVKLCLDWRTPLVVQDGVLGCSSFYPVVVGAGARNLSCGLKWNGGRIIFRSGHPSRKSCTCSSSVFLFLLVDITVGSLLGQYSLCRFGVLLLLLKTRCGRSLSLRWVQESSRWGSSRIWKTFAVVGISCMLCGRRVIPRGILWSFELVVMGEECLLVLLLLAL